MDEEGTRVLGQLNVVRQPFQDIVHRPIVNERRLPRAPQVIDGDVMVRPVEGLLAILAVLQLQVIT